MSNRWLIKKNLRLTQKLLKSEISDVRKNSNEYWILAGMLAQVEQALTTLDYDPKATHPALMCFLKWKDSWVDRPESQKDDYVFNEEAVLADYTVNFLRNTVPELEAMDPTHTFFAVEEYLGLRIIGNDGTNDVDWVLIPWNEDEEGKQFV